MRRTRFSVRPGTAIATLALFFALGGSAFAVGEHMQAASAAQQRCAQGAVRGIAHITGAASIPGQFSGSKALFARRFNCTGRATQVRRLGIGIYEVRFVGNRAQNAIANGVAGVQASADSLGGGTFRVNVYPAGRNDPADLAFVLVAV